jgi:hypothetical protein
MDNWPADDPEKLKLLSKHLKENGLGIHSVVQISGIISGAMRNEAGLKGIKRK